MENNYYEKNKDIVKEKAKQKYYYDKERILARRRELYLERHKDKKRQYSLEYNRIHKDIINERLRNKRLLTGCKPKPRLNMTNEEKKDRHRKQISEWALNNYYKNKTKLNTWQKEYHKRMYHSNIQFKIKNVIRGRLNNAIKLGYWPTTIKLRKNKPRYFNTMDDLFGCTFQEFIKHIESKLKEGMNFNDRSLWHIDHIVPVSNFDLTDPEQVKQAYHYTNLEPIWAKENRTKARKRRVIPSDQTTL